MNIPKVYINDMFTSIQGEGHLTGHVTKFIRMQGCSVGCKWCDSKRTWKKGKGKIWSVFDLSKEIINTVSKDTWLCFTGGEPLEQMKSLQWMIEKLYRAEFRNISIETSGVPVNDVIEIIDLNNCGVFFSLSPKLPSALGKRFDSNMFAQILGLWYNNVVPDYKLQFKFVVSTEEDLKLLDDLFSNAKFNCHLFLQIEHSAIGDKLLLKKILKFSKKHKQFRVTIQQHRVIGVK